MKPCETLPTVLKIWRVQAQRQAGFRGAVWLRIEQARREASFPAYLKAHAGMLSIALVCTLTLSSLTGLRLAHNHDQAQDKAWAERYVASLDPRLLVASNDSQP